MISNTKDIWRLESKWSVHDRFWTDHDRKLAEFSSDFLLNFSCAHKHSRQSSYKKITEKHGKLKEFTEKTRKPLRRREVQENQKGYTSRPLAIIFFSILSTLSQHFNDSWLFSTNFVFSMPFVGSRGPKVCNQSVYHDLIA